MNQAIAATELYSLSREIKATMHRPLLLLLLTACVAGSCAAQNRRSEILARASQIFGPPLSEHDVFKLNNRYVVWLVTRTDGTLFEVTVGPKSFYSNEFPDQQRPSGPESLSDSEFQEALTRISELKPIGQLKQKQYDTMPGLSGPLQTDEYEKAFVEKVLHPAASNANVGDAAWRFSVYYIEEVPAHPNAC